MPTLQPRLNVVLEPGIYAGIVRLAERQGISRSLVARDLLKSALELHEDLFWQENAQVRAGSFSRKNAKTHQEVWH